MNTVQLIGRLTQDPELRYTQTGMATSTLRLAVPRRKKDGEEQPPVYVDVVTFAKQAEAVAQHLAKGRRVAITGRLEYREWKDRNDGSPHSKHEVIADQVEFMDPPKNGNANAANVEFAPGEEPY